MHFTDLLSDRARLTPHREALVELATGRRFSYTELDRRADRCAGFLRERMGVREGDRVCILAHNGVEYVDLLNALARLGAVLAPLNWRLTAGELAFMLDDLDARALLVGPEFVHVLDELYARTRVPAVAAVQGAEIPGAPSYDAEMERAAPAPPPRPAMDGETPLCILYTSGTTGQPKGAVLPHRQLLWNCISTVASWGLREDDVSPVFTPLFHAGGLFAFLTPLLYVGGRVVLGRTFDADASLRAIQEEACTVVLGVPTLFQMWSAAPAFADADLSRVRFFISGGAPCPPAVMEQWRRDKGVSFRQGFGMTEVGVNCFSMTDQEAVAHAGSIGKPVMHARARVVDPDTGEEMGADQPGELLLSGPHVFSGYWRRPQATAEVLRDGWFRTGDTVRRDARGFFYVVGRSKDMIKTGGENVYAAEVEAVFRQHPAVADAALLGEPDARWGEVGVMVVALRPGQDCEERALLQFCDGRLARFKIPRRVVLVDALPYSPYGKVQKAELRRLHLAPVAEAR